jgi:hypothetical protein
VKHGFQDKIAVAVHAVHAVLTPWLQSQFGWLLLLFGWLMRGGVLASCDASRRCL